MALITWQVRVPQELLERLDRSAKRLVLDKKTPTQFEWLTSTPEGRYALSMYQRNTEMRDWSEKRVNKWLRAQYEAATGAQIKSGRPALNEHRLAVMSLALDALEAHENVAA